MINFNVLYTCRNAGLSSFFGAYFTLGLRARGEVRRCTVLASPEWANGVKCILDNP